METLVAILLAGLVITYVGYPLLQPPRIEEEEPEPKETRLGEVVAQKESTLEAIAELDFDHAMGNLSETDYQELRDRYRLKALALLKQEDEMVQEVVAKPNEVVEEAVVAGDAKPRKQGVLKHCSSCGTPLATGDRFCAACGNPFGGSGCPNCGAHNEPGDAFCAKCGQKLLAKGRK